MSSSYLTEKNYITFLYLHSALDLSYVRRKELAFYYLNFAIPTHCPSPFLGKAALITASPDFSGLCSWFVLGHSVLSMTCWH